MNKVAQYYRDWKSLSLRNSERTGGTVRANKTGAAVEVMKAVRCD